MISGQWFQRKRFIKNWPKIAKKNTQNSMKNKVSTMIFKNLVGVHPRKIHTKFETNPTDTG